MEKIELDVFSRASNMPVMKLPTRSFPGVLIQGDSLSILYNRAKELYDLCEASGLKRVQTLDDPDGPLDLAFELVELLGKYVAHYEEVLQSYNMRLPYNGPLISKDENEEINS